MEFRRSEEVFNSLDGSDSGVTVFVAEENGDVVAHAAYSEKGDIGCLEYIEVDEGYQGQGIAGELIDIGLNESQDVDAIYSQATSMTGQIQHLLQERGFEASGFSLTSEEKPDKNRLGGVLAYLWNINDEVEAYIPEEVRDFTETSLETQREITYLEPDSDTEESYDLASPHKLPETISVDTSEPTAEPIISQLYSRGYRPIRFSPALNGQELVMADLKEETAQVNLTEDTLELLKASDASFKIDDEKGGFFTVTFNPREIKVNPETASDSEIDRFYRQIAND